MIIELETCALDYPKDLISPIHHSTVSKVQETHPRGYEEFIYLQDSADKNKDFVCDGKQYKHGTRIGYANLSKWMNLEMFYCETCGTIIPALWRTLSFTLSPAGIGWNGFPEHDSYCGHVISGPIKDWNASKYDYRLKPYFAKKEEIEAYNRTVNEKRNNFRNNPCPICGSKSFWSKEYSLPDYTQIAILKRNGKIRLEDEFKYKIEEFQEEINEIDREKSADLIKMLNKQINKSPSKKVSIAKPEITKNTPSSLIKYIEVLINLEAEIFSLTNRLEDLYNYRFQADRSAIAAKYLFAKQVADAAEIDIKHREEEYKAIQLKLTQLKTARSSISSPQKPSIADPNYPVKPDAPIYEQPKLFNKKKVLAANAEKEKKYNEAIIVYEQKVRDVKAQKQKNREEETRLWNEALRKYEDAIRKEKEEKNIKVAEAEKSLASALSAYEQAKQDAEARIAAASNIVSHPSFDVKMAIDDEITAAEELLDNLYKCRNELYSTNIIFSKYRNIVALSSFYEYLMSGRVESLEGPNGAYNLYESEVRANLVIAQLSTIIESLEQIKENQYMIYSKLEEINENLEELKATTDAMLRELQNISTYSAQSAKNTDKIIQNTAITAHNTAVTAFYAKKNAELTNALGYMVAFK